MFFIYSYLVFATFLINCRTLNGMIDSEDDKPWSLFDTWLSKPLVHIPHLQLKLRSANYLEDIENPYIIWFLRHTQIPYTLSTYELMKRNNLIALKSPIDDYNYVIVTSMQDMRSTIQYFAQKSGTYFYVVADDDVNYQELQDICHTLWTNSRILFQLFLTSSGVLIYDPFHENESGDYGKIIVYKGEQTIENTLFNDMRGYPLRIQIFQSVYSRPVVNEETKKVEYAEGLDGRVAEILQQRMNFTMNFMEPDKDYFGERLPNGSYNGAIGSILDNSIDICFTGFFVKDYFTRDISFSVAMYEDNLCIYIRKAQRVPDYLLPIFAVHFNVWIGFIGIAFLLSLIWAMLRGLTLALNIYSYNSLTENLRKPLRYQYPRILIDTWVAWVRVSLNQYPMFKSERVLVVSFCLVSVIFGAIFECSLASSHIEPLYFKDINSLQELNNTGLPILYRHASMKDDLFVGETSPLYASLNRKTIHMPDRKYNILMEIVKTGQLAGVNRYNSLMLESLDLIITKKIWIIQEFPKRYSISYVWHRNAPWEETLNNLLLKFSQAGIIQKFEHDMDLEAKMNLIKYQLIGDNAIFRILTVKDLQLAFYVVTIGNMLATLSWIFEKVVFALQHRSKK
uniref:Ionotropic glutamate receptor L-glutamate and glycine-binding domain-containing protein n=1 Tax=Stomoxys calcitrans TaxID=35570 RepID=A0A2Y9D4M1_STOCA